MGNIKLACYKNVSKAARKGKSHFGFNFYITWLDSPKTASKVVTVTDFNERS